MALVHDNDFACIDVGVCLVICLLRYPPHPCSRGQPFGRINLWDTSGTLRQRFNNFRVVRYWLFHDSMDHYIEGIYTKNCCPATKADEDLI